MSTRRSRSDLPDRPVRHSLSQPIARMATRDALGLLDDDELLASVNSFLEDAQSDLAQPKPQRRPRCPRRLEIRALQDELTRLNALHKVLTERGTSSRNAARERDDAGWWRTAAKRELKRREVVVQENLRLRSEVAMNAELIRRIRRQVRHLQSKLAPPAASARVANSRAGATKQHSKGSSVFSLLSARTHEVYEKTESLYEDPRLQLNYVIARVHDVRIRDEGLGVEHIDARVVPFSMEPTAEVVWKWLMSDNPVMEFTIAQREHVGNDMVQISFGGESLLTETRLTCNGDLVVRRFDEKDRVVFIASAKMNPEKVNAESMGGVAVHVSLWIIISRMSHPRSSATSDFTEIVRRDLSNISQRTSNLELLQHTIAEVHEKQQQSLVEYIDNTHLDKYLGNRASN